MTDPVLLRSRDRPRVRAKRWLMVLILGAIAISLGYGLFIRATQIRPPEISAEMRAQAELPLEVKGPRSYIGKSWLGRERGIWELHLFGDPYALGYAQGRLADRLFLNAEDYMFREMNRYIPSKIALQLVRLGVRLRYRHLGDQLPPDRAVEIAGIASGVADLHGDFLPIYHRLVFYHALHDITQSLENSPLLGCSAFAASGSATSNGHLLIGRNFDFEGPEPFDGDKAVLFFRPTGKIPFASVAWGGMAGVVTGLNGEGIYVSINASRSDDKGKDGIPVEILVREVLEQAKSVDDAIAIVKKSPVMVPDFYLVGDGKTGDSAVIERTPTRIEVRRSRGSIDRNGASDAPLVLTNHALAPAFSGDAENDRLKRYLTSGARYRRMSELVQRWRGLIDPKKVLEILRDKKGDGVAPLGLGNRNALDALIATHSVVVDATSLILWVGEGPHLIGRYRAFDLRKELYDEERAAPADLPPDNLSEDDLRNFHDAQAAIKAAHELEKAGAHERALEEAEKAVALEDNLPEARRLLGDLYRAAQRPDDARRQYQRFLELNPPYLKDIEQVRGILGSL